MELQISCIGDDVTAVLPLESGSNRLHCLVVAERELNRFGFVNRRFAASIESSWPRKKDKKEVITLLLKQLRKKQKGAAPAVADVKHTCAMTLSYHIRMSPFHFVAAANLSRVLQLS